ncbi:MAG: outer membrane protein assembly factor BamA [Chitinispirillia bacterium]|nr:outer membrane protein assembly factor BamA [Chitinispirillia bacterium]MCL2241179.1 outer membrane protein assembly factor BamA [Chitinispirillia bacterium]
MRKIFTAAALIICLILVSALFVRTDAKVLEDIRIKGLLVTKTEIVRDAILLEPGKEFTPSDVQESVRRLYALGLFRTIDFVIDEETGESVILAIELEEFPLVDRIEFEGNRKIKTKELEEARVIGLYHPLSDAQLHKSRQAIANMYAEKGYLLAEIGAQVINSVVPGNAIVKYTIDEGPRVRVRTIKFDGNDSVKTSKLTGKFKTKTNRWWHAGDFNEERYRAHLDTLVMYYNELGFLDAAIERDSVWHSGDKRDIHIEITVAEGRRYYAGDIAFTGNRIIESDSLLPKVALAKGKYFRKSQFEMTRYMLETAYREEGYLWVRVDDKRVYRGENSDTVDLVFEIAEGRPAIVRKVDIRGNSKTWEKVIRREIRLMPGQRYRQSLMALSQQNIFRLNYFTNIVPDIMQNDDGTIDIIFDITERDNIGQLTVGAAYSDQDKLTGTFGMAIPNFRGAGQEFKIDVQYGAYRKLGMVSFTEPWAFDTPLWLTGTVFADQQIYSYYQSENPYDTTMSYGFRIGAGRSRLKWPDNKFRFQAIYQLSHEQTNRETVSLSNMQIVETGVLSRLRLNIERYDLDMPLFPNDGSRLTITPEFAGLGGDYRYLKGTVSYENYFRLPGKLVFGSEVKFGAITKLGKDLIISGNDLFTGGGAYGDAVIRGYQDWAFGGYYNRREGDGISMFAANLSLRYPVIDQQVYLGVFMDMGNTWPRISGMDLNDLYRGVGGGMRINLPMIGVMGVDIGYGLDPRNKRDLDAKPNGVTWHIIMNKGF